MPDLIPSILETYTLQPNVTISFVGYRPRHDGANAIGPIENIEKYECIELVQFNQNTCRARVDEDPNKGERVIRIELGGSGMLHNIHGPALLRFKLVRDPKAYRYIHTVVSSEYYISGTKISDLGTVIQVRDDEIEFYRALGFVTSGNYVVQYTKEKRK